MRRYFFLLIVIFSTISVYAQTSGLLINENFTGYPSGNLNGQGGWLSSGNSDYVQALNSLPLIYPGYMGDAQYVNVAQKGDYITASGNYPEDPYKPFSDGVISVVTDNTSFYISFLVRVPDAAGTQTTGNARPTMALRAVNGSTLAHFYIAHDANGTGLKFGIGKDAQQGGVFASASYNFSTTYLIVLRYDVANGNATGDYDDKMYLWVNPSLASEPSGKSAQAAIDNFNDFNYDGGFTGVILFLQLFQEANSATASFDAFKVAYAAGFPSAERNASAAWDALGAASEPQPVKVSSISGVSSIKARPVNAGIQVEWTVNSEVNVSKYTIERSSNGVSFVTAGTAVPENGTGIVYYEWLDVLPEAGDNYYRIKKVYKEGKVLYSLIVKVRPGILLDGAIRIYPNPVTANIISLEGAGLRKGNYEIAVFSTSGQQLYKEQFSHAGGTINHSLKLPNALQAGIYNIQLNGNGLKLVKQFLVR